MPSDGCPYVVLLGPLLFPHAATGGRQSADPQRAHLQVRVTEHHELGAGVDVIPFDEWEVHSSDPIQAREVGTPLPVLGVLLHHLLSELGLLAAHHRTWAGTDTQNHNSTFCFQFSFSTIKRVSETFASEKYLDFTVKIPICECLEARCSLFHTTMCPNTMKWIY